MKVFKFGGASLRHAKAIENVGRIIQQHLKETKNEPLVVVVSAMGKTTNALERVHGLYKAGEDHLPDLNQLKDYHWKTVGEIIPQQRQGEVLDMMAVFAHQMWAALKSEGGFDQTYDQYVSYGEILSSYLLNSYLHELSISSTWLDSRKFIVTDNSFREAKVDWGKTCRQIKQIEFTTPVMVTQGFIGSSPDGLTTTLGREGSDFSAAIFGSCLDAESVTIWKDVPGVMNADPKRLPAAVVFDELPFKEAAEMTYYGASVIHPKTIKPLANKGIPLLVKSFDDPSLPGTQIRECVVDQLPPLIVFKDNQCLVSCKVTDYTFIDEEQFSKIFHALATLDIKINLMQNSAISFSFCVDFRESKVTKLIKLLSEHFEVYYNTNLTLITIKNYDQKTFQEYRGKWGVVLEQSSRSTLQVLVKN